MSRSSERVTGSGTLGLVAAIVVTLGLLYFVPAIFSGAEVAVWPWFGADLLSLLLGIVALVCAAAATIDCWFAVGRARRRTPRSYLQSAGVLLLVACLAAGPLLALPLLPGLVLTWAAIAQLRPVDAEPSAEA